eukprot:CAMPEP_0202849110 /NCGR_PEP_ID=MMETSP1389-20130828/79839_1 /ASSEMBLY_ACC=CAM_ASM_000865 /TAXON_ID=302021 /ORGANISM="Rhodomonas sp., Strain CCMP768" /LENGTH=70 /DNA_ID=CAMNT_0049527075 /DNA_START=64 /DNA_END=273 /DNA_ORIENTATION=+
MMPQVRATAHEPPLSPPLTNGIVACSAPDRPQKDTTAFTAQVSICVDRHRVSLQLIQLDLSAGLGLERDG